MTLAKFGEVDEAMKILHGHSNALQKDLQAGTGEKFFPLVDDYRGLYGIIQVVPGQAGGGSFKNWNAYSL